MCLPSFPEEFETRKGEEHRIAWKLEGTIEIIWAIIQSEKTEAQRRELISPRLHSKVITGLELEGWLPDCIQCSFNLWPRSVVPPAHSDSISRERCNCRIS